MSKLEKLISELCSSGVESIPLQEVATIQRGVRVVRSQLASEGDYPVFQNSLTPLGYHTKSNCTSETTFIICAGAAGDIGYSHVDFWAADDCHYFHCSDQLNSRYLYHVLLWQQPYLYSQVRRGSIPRLSRTVIEKLKIPVPPLPIQQEIARILDELSEHSSNLIKQLSVELDARKKQYEYYRDKVFNDCKCDPLSVSEIAWTNIGLATSVTKHKRESGVLLLHNSDIQQNSIQIKKKEYISEEFALKNKAKILHKNDIITVHTGDVGTSAVIDEKYDGAIGFTTITTRIKDTQRILPHYVCHYLNSMRCKSDITSMTISDRSNLNQGSFETLMIPIPHIDIQREIIRTLDQLHRLYSDLSDSILIETEKRQQQFEYYRDKLLRFEVS